ncbi:MAG TPA: TIGR00730 family Rossman fold protein [Acidothermaceae bacterium]|nr:TIGR00730 family Rossman fold protein [Acidothermaceae bacterium]
MTTICVYCASSERIDPRYIELATQVGTEIARRGYGLVSGGGSVSCMGAVARAVRAGGGRTTGVIPQALVDMEVADGDADELVVTRDLRERKGQMDSRSDGFLALPGGLGTLDEIFEIWVSRTLGMHDKPLVVLDPDGVFAMMRAQVDDLVLRGFARPAVRDAIQWATEVGEALDMLEALPVRIVPTAGEVLESDP